MKGKTYFIIPARKGSKGFPFKNRKLLQFTINQIPKNLQEKIIVTTNDDYIIQKLKSTKIKILKRDPKLCTDKTSIRDVMQNVSEEFQMNLNDTIVMLYLTSPSRKYGDTVKILNYYKKNKLKTLTCCVEPKTHPYLCLYKKKGNKGRQIVKHDLYRRQDYPKCIEIRHFVCIFQVSEIPKLNRNMYNENTVFYNIDNDVDIDYKKDLEEFIYSKQKQKI